MLDVNRGYDGLSPEEPLPILSFETCAPAIFNDELNNPAVRQDSPAIGFDHPHDRVRQLAEPPRGMGQLNF